jgi:hypothetical protein
LLRTSTQLAAHSDLTGALKALDSAADFITNEGATQMSDDQLLGLDGIMSEEDAKMMKYYKESLKYKSHH